MKKFFVEPDIQKLSLNLHENIATSSGCVWPTIFFFEYNYIYVDLHPMAVVKPKYESMKSSRNFKEGIPYLKSLGSCVYWVTQPNNDG